MFGIIQSKKCSTWNDKTSFLDRFSFYEGHELSGFRVPAKRIVETVINQDLRKDYLINILLSLRELPNRIIGGHDGQQLTFDSHKFTLLSRSSHEVLYGLVGEFWRPSFGLFEVKDADEFLKFNDEQVAKLVLRYKVIDQIDNTSILRTETYIYCPSLRTKLLFMCYWVVIRPFSGWIRRRILKQVYRNLHDN